MNLSQRVKEQIFRDEIKRKFSEIHTQHVMKVEELRKQHQTEMVM